MEPIFQGEALVEVGRAAARLAWEGGMTVRRPDGTVVPIPLVAEPEAPSRAELRAVAREAESRLRRVGDQLAQNGASAAR